MEIFFKVLIIGIFATAIIDLWSILSSKILKMPRTNWAMVGRWLGHIPSGKFFLDPASPSSEIPSENSIGWAFHYFIGVIYAAIYTALVFCFFDQQPTLFSAWVFGVLTILSPWFILQPALGVGICAAKAPKPNMVRLQNFVIHSIFGVALYIGWLGVNA